MVLEITKQLEQELNKHVINIYVIPCKIGSKIFVPVAPCVYVIYLTYPYNTLLYIGYSKRCYVRLNYHFYNFNEKSSNLVPKIRELSKALNTPLSELRFKLIVLMIDSEEYAKIIEKKLIQDLRPVLNVLYKY